MKHDVSLGVRMRAARGRLGLTQAQLAEPGYSVAYVSRIEAGERTPSPEALAVFAKRLGLSPTALLDPLDDTVRLEAERLHADALKALDETDWNAAKTAADRLLAIGREHGFSRFQSQALTTLGEIQERSDRLDDALALYESVERLTSSEDRGTWVDVRVRIARTHRRLGDLGESGDALEEAYDLIAPEAALYPALMARICLHLAATCSERGDQARARRIGLEGVEHAKAAGDTRTLASALWAAAPPMAAADPARALSLIRRAGTLYAELGLTLELGRLHSMMGVVALQAGDRSTARTALDRAVEIMGAAATSSVMSTVLTARADLELEEGNRDEAVGLAREVIVLAEGVEPLEQARAHRILGEAQAHDDPEAAERELRRAIELFSSAGAQMESARCFRSLGELLVAQGRTDEALAVFRDGLGVVEGAA